jgi:hypothetical protein
MGRKHLNKTREELLIQQRIRSKRYYERHKLKLIEKVMKRYWEKKEEELID